MKHRIALAFCLFLPLLLYADAGVLIPSTRKQPDPAVLSLEEMSIDVLIDNADARVSVRQIFANHEGSVLEGTYLFALPGRALVSDFAVWDGVVRIPGVILERRRAEEIYQELKWQAIDPGLLQMGERDTDEARRTAVFSARIVPIPAYGSKRLEMEYHERIPVEDLKSFFAIPLRPDAYRAQIAGRLSIAFELRSKHPLRDFRVAGSTYPLQITERTPNLVKGSFEGRGVRLAEDFAVEYTIDPARGDSMEVLTHRETSGPGFFEAQALLAPAAARAGTQRTVIALFDTSLSMQWEKLERSFRALETLLRSLAPADRFNLLLFNTEVTSFATGPVAADAAAVEKALAFVRASRLRGGTNLQAALEAGLAQSGAGAYLVLFTDGGATRGAIHSGKLAQWYAGRWRKGTRTYIFAVGDDANVPLLRMLARNDGVLEWVRSTEPIEFKLNAFLSKIGRRPVEGLRLVAEPAPNFDLIYPLEDNWFRGSVASWVGQYAKPIQATFSGQNIRATVSLPAEDLDHPQLPRTWAKARVDALLEKIEREGEDRASIDEIIRLARKYKFVTPYTSFLAAPRALLRPRLIRPGDPILRVKTDSSIVSVAALFPFGLVKQLRYLPQEDIWQTRFLAPADMKDGSYQVRLILRDRKGHVYRESKGFVIASKPPVVRVKLDKTRVRPGDAVRLRVSASETTRTISARMYGTPAVYIRWSPEAATNTGDLVIPAHLPAGRYTLTVTAEDFAHNIGSQEVSIEVAP